MSENFTNLYDVVKLYMSEEEIEEIHRAFLFASKAHESQIRKSGEPYIIHPIAVSIILAKQSLSKDVIISGLLHDVVEDTEYTYEDIAENFSEEIADIVEGVTKLGSIEGYTYDQIQAENHRKIIISAAKDVRIILVKLADRLHNMRTIGYMNQEKQKLIANETLEVYAPIAHRLGMYEVKWELEDLSFKCLNPEKYHEIAAKIELKKSEREEIVEETLDEINKILAERKIKATIKGRSKHIYSIYRKLNQGKHYEDILDLFAFRIIVNTIPDCYLVLGIIHEHFKPIPMRFKDYIPTPKHNMYQSIHTTVLTKQAIPMEFQIRTKKMDSEAEFGIASHWMYKEQKNDKEFQEEINQKLTWLRKILEEGDLDGDSQKFMKTVKGDYLSKSIFVFTPKGDMIELPEKSIVLDFAFAIHTNIGCHALNAKVNDKVVSLFYRLQMGDVVKIMISQHAEPSLNWISKVKTTRAKEALKKHFKNVEKKKIQEEGRKIFLDLQKTNPNINFKEIDATDQILTVIQNFGVLKKEEFFYLIGMGEVDTEDIIKIIKHKTLPTNKREKEILIETNKKDYSTRICKYCSPLPGDKIKAIKIKENSFDEQYYIHRDECMQQQGKEYKAEFTEQGSEGMYICRIELHFEDKEKILLKIVNALSKMEYNITSIYARGNLENQGICRISLEVKGLKDYKRIKKELLKIEEVISVNRLITKVED